METLQDLLNPANDNIPIVEDPRSGDVSMPGATLVEITDQHSFLELLRVGEANRIAANTKLNTESSRSHAILMVIEYSLFGLPFIFFIFDSKGHKSRKLLSYCFLFLKNNIQS